MSARPKEPELVQAPVPIQPPLTPDAFTAMWRLVTEKENIVRVCDDGGAAAIVVPEAVFDHLVKLAKRDPGAAPQPEED